MFVGTMKYRMMAKPKVDALKPEINSNYFYAVLNALEVEVQDQPTTRLIKLRNPWGPHTFKGDYGPESPHWDEDLKGLLKYDPAVDPGSGIFWITLQEFLATFENFGAYKNFSGVGVNYFKCKQTVQSNISFFKFTIKEDCFAHIYVIQKSEHMLKQLYPGYKYSYSRLIITKSDDILSINKFIHGSYENNQLNCFEGKMTAGEYVVCVEMDWEQQDYNSFVFYTSCQPTADILEMPVTPDVYERFYAQMLMKLEYTPVSWNHNCKKTIYRGKRGEEIVHRYEYIHSGINIIYYMNVSDRATCHEHHLSADKTFYLYTPDHQERKHEIRVEVGPHQEKLVMFRKDPKSSELMGKIDGLLNFQEYYSPEELLQITPTLKAEEEVKDPNIAVYKFKFYGGEAHYFKYNSNQECSFKLTFSNLENYLVNGKEELEIVKVFKKGDYLMLNLRVKDVLKKATYNYDYVTEYEVIGH
jgi:hypothetical protein